MGNLINAAFEHYRDNGLLSAVTSIRMVAVNQAGHMAEWISHYRRQGLRAIVSSTGTTGANRILTHPLLDPLGYRISLRRLRAHQRTEHALDGVLGTTFNFRGVGHYQTIAPDQIQAELRELVQEVSDHEPETILEIGSKNGGTLYMWARYLDSPTSIVSLDLPGGAFGGGYDHHQVRFFKQFDPEAKANIRCIRDDSHALSTKEQVKEALDGTAVDFLFIDGDHTYGGVKADFEMYSPLVRDGGLIAFHDIVEDPNHPNSEVDQLWAELKDDYHSEEIVASPDQGWAGIGLIRV